MAEVFDLPKGSIPSTGIKTLTRGQQIAEDFNQITGDAAKAFVFSGGTMGAGALAEKGAAAMGLPQMLQRAAGPAGRAIMNAITGAAQAPPGARGAGALQSVAGGAVGEALPIAGNLAAGQVFKGPIQKAAQETFDTGQAISRGAHGISEAARAGEHATGQAVAKGAHEISEAARYGKFAEGEGAKKSAFEGQKLAQQRGYEQAVEARKTGYANAQAAQAKQFETAQAAHAEKAATSIAGHYQQAVPAWSGIPADTKGLLRMVYGDGQKLLSEGFDKAMKDIGEVARGRKVVLSLDDISALKLKPTGVIDSSEGLKQGFADAQAVAKAATGRWMKEPDLYRRVVGAMDKEGLGDPAAREAYRHGQELIRFMDKTKALEGEKLHPDRILAGLTNLKKLEELRRRGGGNIFEGPMQAARGGPQAPAPIQEPPAVPKPIPLAKPEAGTFDPRKFQGSEFPPQSFQDKTFEPRGRIDTALQGPQSPTMKVGGKTIPTALPKSLQPLLSALGGQFPNAMMGGAALAADTLDPRNLLKPKKSADELLDALQ